MAATLHDILAGSMVADVGGAERNYSYTVTVDTDTSCGALEATLADGLPTTDVSYFTYGREQDVAAICRRKSPRQRGPTLWEVTCHFSTTSPAGDSANKNDPAQYNDNPLLDALEVSFNGRNISAVMDRDWDGYPFVNAAGEPYGPEVATHERGLFTFTIKKNEPYAKWSLWYATMNTLNSNPFYVADPGQARMAPPRGSFKSRNGIVFCETIYTVEVDPWAMWNQQYLNAGTWYKLNGVNVPAVIKDTVNNSGYLTEHVLLDADGGKIANQSTPQQRLANATYIRFRKYKSADWSALGIGG